MGIGGLGLVPQVKPAVKGHIAMYSNTPISVVKKKKKKKAVSK